MKLTDEQQKKRLINGEPGPFEFSGLLNLDNTSLAQLPEGITCYELSARNSQLTCLPNNLHVVSKITLDHSEKLTHLPPGLKTGSLSLEGCNALQTLPEGIDVWFLKLDNCANFDTWPGSGKIQHGSLSLRNCVSLRSLPTWLGSIANIDISGCTQLAEIPDGLDINGWLDIGECGISSLPESHSDVSIHWRGVPVSKRVAFEPESITSKEVLDAPNAEIRRVMIERMGYLKFATDAGATTLDSDTDPGGARSLLKIELENDEPLVGLSCACPSTGRRYLLRVPPDTTSCHQAAAWIAGYDDPALYGPCIET